MNYLDNSLKKKLKKNLPIEEIKLADVQEIMLNIEDIGESDNFSYLKRLLFCSFACKRDRYINLKDKAVERFE